MHLDPLLPTVVAACAAIMLVGFVLQRFRMPHVVAYLLAGVLLGPYGLALFTDQATLMRVGDFGVVLLLFFVGMETSLHELISNWKVALGGTLLQIVASVACAAALGLALDWSWARILLLGFVISLSSTAVIVAMLRQWGRLDSLVGKDALSILIMQDLAIIPMLIVVGLFGAEAPSGGAVALQVVGGIAAVVTVVVLFKKGRIALPFSQSLRGDHELQVFGALFVCFGTAALTAALGLSTALGAFVGGMIVASARETEWVQESLEAFRVVLTAGFFVAIGLLVDLPFLWANLLTICGLMVAALLTNTLINALTLITFGRPWRHGLFTGALLAQLGEFGFVLAAVGVQVGAISDVGYQLAIAVIALSLLVSPLWIKLFARFDDGGAAASAA